VKGGGSVDVCGCDASVKVGGLDYYCLKRRRGLFGSTSYGVLRRAGRLHRGLPPSLRNGWRPADDWVAKLDPDPDVDLERIGMLRALIEIGGMREEFSV
jgi:hypothetical protein